MISFQLNIFVIFGKFLWSNFHSTNIGVQSYCLHYLSLSIPFKFSVSIASQKCNLILFFTKSCILTLSSSLLGIKEFHRIAQQARILRTPARKKPRRWHKGCRRTTGSLASPATMTRGRERRRASRNGGFGQKYQC